MTRHEKLAALGLTEEDAELRPWDSCEYLDSPEGITAYLEEAFATGDAAFIGGCVGDVAKALALTDLARRIGVGRKELLDAFSGKTPPRMDIILAALGALGLRLHAVSPDVPNEMETAEEAVAHG